MCGLRIPSLLFANDVFLFGQAGVAATSGGVHVSKGLFTSVRKVEQGIEK